MTVTETTKRSPHAADADKALKTKHAAMWATAIPPGGDDRRDAGRYAGRGRSRSEPATGSLDVAAGTGNAALPAARPAPTVTARDLTPELLGSGGGRRTPRG